MDQIKRKLSFNQSLKEDIKKSRNEFDQTITSIENFSNEFFYEIFDYLYGDDIYKAFSNLNDRFQQLLNSSAVLFKIYIDDSKYNDTYMNKYEEFFRQNKHKILSLNIQLLKESNKYSSFFTVNSLFNCLESLIIDICESTRLIAILINLSCLPRLFSLTIELPCSTKILNDTYRIIFTLSTLKTCRLKGWKNEESISLPMASNQKLNTLKYLTIDHHCTLNELYIIISYTPQLHRLNLLYDFEIDSNIKTILPIKLSNLTSISLHMNRVNFDEFEIFIKKLYSYLKILRITNQSKDITFLNAHRWEQLVLQCIPQLEEFDLQYYEQRNDQFDYSSYTRESDQFISSFWIERKWIFEIEINNESINYLIHPYRKRWYENCNSIPDLTKFTRLTLTYILPDSLHESVIVDIKRVLTIAQVYHLEIPEENIFIGALIEALNLVPELNTLKIYSLSLYEPRNLSFEEYMILCSIEDISKITKVYLEKMNIIEEFYFLLALCPFMTYFKVDSINDMNIESILEKIVEKISRDSNNYLRRLCFYIPMADDRMIQQLRIMIDCKKLLLNYRIKRLAENVYIEWQ